MEKAERQTTGTEKVQQQWLRATLSKALENGSSVSLWRLPEANETNLIISEAPVIINEVALEESSPGFIIAPFNPARPKYLLQADDHFVITKEAIFKNGSEIEINETESLEKRHVKFHFRNPSSNHKTENKFIDLVREGIRSIERGQFEKVVPSRSHQLPLSADLTDVFEKLCTNYPNALVSLVSSPAIGTWIGASPELLVSVNTQGIFKTAALAGTQQYKPGTDLKTISWTQKEIEEQALVERYIISCLKKIRLREFDEHGPKTVRAGNLIHLKTDFEVDTKATNFPLLGSVMLKLLHPTSAVCGMPMENSLDFLLSRENYDREFYSGFVGPVNMNGESHIYVNLRCMQALEEHAILYAGAGVTIDSDPQKEWEETEMKMNTLLQIIQS